MNIWKLVAGLIATTPLISCAVIGDATAPIFDTFQREYSAKAITLMIVDEDTGAPLEGVIATANWELVTGSYAGGSVVRGQLKILETDSGKDGRIYFPAWGPEPNRHGGHIRDADPQIFLYKPGYKPVRLTNFNRFMNLPHQEIPGGYSHESVRHSLWDGETIKLAKVSGTKYVYLHTTLSGIVSGLDFAFSGFDCKWKIIPRMTAALLNEKAIGHHRLNEKECGSAASVLKGLLK